MGTSVNKQINWQCDVEAWVGARSHISDIENRRGRPKHPVEETLTDFGRPEVYLPKAGG